jgi:hypothetical protein
MFEPAAGRRSLILESVKSQNLRLLRQQVIGSEISCLSDTATDLVENLLGNGRRWRRWSGRRICQSKRPRRGDPPYPPHPAIPGALPAHPRVRLACAVRHSIHTHWADAWPAMGAEVSPCHIALWPGSMSLCLRFSRYSYPGTLRWRADDRQGELPTLLPEQSTGRISHRPFSSQHAPQVPI